MRSPCLTFSKHYFISIFELLKYFYSVRCPGSVMVIGAGIGIGEFSCAHFRINTLREDTDQHFLPTKLWVKLHGRLYFLALSGSQSWKTIILNSTPWRRKLKTNPLSSSKSDVTSLKITNLSRHDGNRFEETWNFNKKSYTL